jgi:hypothetical protein
LGIIGSLIGGERRALQTQFPTSGIELWGCDRFGRRSPHLTNRLNACAGSVTGINPTSAHHGARSRDRDDRADEWTERAASQKLLFMLIISSIRGQAFHRKKLSYFFASQRPWTNSANFAGFDRSNLAGD